MNVCPDNINPRNYTNIHRLQVGEKEEDPDWDAPNTASSWHWPNWSTNLEFSLSKCFLLGQFNMAKATEWKYDLVKITVRSPQKKTLMVVELISASLWGCLACECIIIGMTGQYPAQRLHCCGGGLPWFVASITQTRALTWDVTAVSATCWGSVGQHQLQHLCHHQVNPPSWSAAPKGNPSAHHVTKITSTWAWADHCDSVSASCWGDHSGQLL